MGSLSNHNSFVIAALLLLISFLVNVEVDAFSQGAGHCNEGDLGDGGPNSGHGTTGGGNISQGKLQVKFDSTVLTTFSAITLERNTEYTVTLDFNDSANSNFFYRGFMFRLSEGTGADVSGTFSPSTNTNAKVHSLCAANLSGMTHTNNQDKTSVDFKFNYSGSASSLKLETTVVRERATDNWFFSQFTLNFDDGGTPSPTPASTPSPTPGESSCEDGTYRFKVNKDGTNIWRNCSWVGRKANQIQSRCALVGVDTMCPDTCDTCANCVDSSSRMKFRKSPGTKFITRSCSWTSTVTSRCNIANMDKACRDTCGLC
jgi:hypothetical protein